MVSVLLGEVEVPLCPMCSSVTYFPHGPPHRQPIFGQFDLGFLSVFIPPPSLYS